MRITVNPAADAEIGRNIEALLADKLGPAIVKNAQRTAPVKSGDLRDSIVSQTEANGAATRLQVGVDEDLKGVDYGDFVEEGTSRQAAQPFLVPAVLQAKGKVA